MVREVERREMKPLNFPDKARNGVGGKLLCWSANRGGEGLGKKRRKAREEKEEKSMVGKVERWGGKGKEDKEG